MTRLCSLGSGSRGNGTLIDIGGEYILVDCGFTLKQAETRLLRAGLRPADLSAILVTHEHNDHASGVAPLAYKYALPVYASYGTLKSARNNLVGTAINVHDSFQIGPVKVQPVVVPHDAREPVQFTFEHAGVRLGVISDLGQVTPYVIEQYSGCHGLMMESNYDPEMLLRGRYPENVKRRIASNLGHLSNVQAAEFLNRVAHPNLTVVIGHVSAENNHPDLLQEVFQPFRNQVRELSFATQADGVAWVEVFADQMVAESTS